MSTPHEGGGGPAPMYGQRGPLGRPLIPEQGGQYNPGYGNEANVGYSPGQTGYVPAGWAKFDYQQRQFEQMGYADEQVGLFKEIPIIWAIIWTPVMIMFSGVVLMIAWAFTPFWFAIFSSFGILGVIPGLIATVIMWAVALYLVYLFTIKMWLAALVVHVANKDARTGEHQDLYPPRQ